MKITNNIKPYILGYSIATFTIATQISTEHRIFLRLQSNGEIVKAITKFRDDFWGTYADYYFVTAEGIKIKHSQKCGSKENFDNNFKDLEVIYNKSNPNEFWTYEHFAKYRITWVSIIPIIMLGFFLTKLIQIFTAILSKIWNDMFF